MYLNNHEGYDDAHRYIGHFLNDVYTAKRVHSAVGYLTPQQFEVLHEV